MTARLRVAFCAASAAVLALSTGCSADGVTPDCPPLALYRVREASEREAQAAAREAAAAKGCVTSPLELLGDGGAPSD